MVISHCNQLRVLYLNDLTRITGMFALCEDREPTLCFITMVCDILAAGSSLATKAHHRTIL
jgi:heme O synthase-like polyprenyltransferase